MKTGRWIGLIVLLVMLLSPVAVFAQGGDEVELVEYVSEDELLTVSLPDGWTVEQLPDFPFPHVAAANSEEAVERLNSDDGEFAMGDQVLLLLILSEELFAMIGAEMPEEVTAGALAEGFAGLFLEPAEDATEEEIAAVSIGEPEEIELEDGRVVGHVMAGDSMAEGSFLALELGEGVLALMFVAAYPGEYTDDLDDLGLQVVSTVAYAGTAEDIFAALMGGAEMEDALDGEALVAERCTTCHTADRINNATKDEAGWTATVDRMIGHGAQLDDAERDAVIAYLSSK